MQIKAMIQNHCVNRSGKQGLKANIPKKTNSQSNNDHMDWYLYKIRHLVENMFCRLKQFRGIATRYDKLKRNYQSSVALACIFYGYLYRVNYEQ